MEEGTILDKARFKNGSKIYKEMAVRVMTDNGYFVWEIARHFDISEADVVRLLGR